MRKLYAFFAGLILCLASTQTMAHTPSADVAIIRETHPDSCSADFERLPVSATSDPLRVYLKALPSHNNDKRPVRICWKFGDGTDTCIQYANTNPGPYVVGHNYAHPGLYEVCVTILYQGGCEARKCKPVRVGPEDECRADFERAPFLSTNDALLTYFKALPWNNNNRKPARICWTFGDGRDTCISYPENYTGAYAVSHRYEHSGTYEVCVKILYYGGCEARKCKPVVIELPDRCTADFERIPTTAANDQLRTYFRALPWNSNDKKPARICWTFGDGRDTCINYGQDYNGQYVVSHNYLQPGTYEVCIKILYYGGCEARKCKTIIIPPIPVTCAVRLFEITPSITSLVRGFLAVPTSAPPRRLERICWVFGDGDDTCIMIDATGPLPDLVIRHTYPGPGIYRACVKVKFQGGCEAYDCVEVRIQGATNTCGGYMVETLSGPRTYKFKGFSIHNPNDQVISYRWTFGDGTGATGEEVSHTYTQGGDYNVCLYIRTQLGCETRICKTVRVPGNNAPTLVLTPNPVINIMHVQFFSTHTETVSIRILNANGIVVRNFIKNVNVGPNNWDHELGNLLPGIYSYILTSPNQLASALFLKQ